MQPKEEDCTVCSESKEMRTSQVR